MDFDQLVADQKTATELIAIRKFLYAATFIICLVGLINLFSTCVVAFIEILDTNHGLDIVKEQIKDCTT